jgi:hypothetical protein
MSNLDATSQVLMTKLQGNMAQQFNFVCKQKAENNIFEHMKSDGSNTKQADARNKLFDTNDKMSEAKLKMFEVQEKAILNEMNSVNKLREKDSIFG